MNKPPRSKIIGFQNWLTLSDAAKSLSNFFEEEITEANILRLALDGHLKLSVNFVNPVPAMCGKVVGHDDVEWKEIQTEDEIVIDTDSIDIGEGRYVNIIPGEFMKIRGVWDLIMSHCVRTDVENRFQMLTGGTEVEPDINDDGVFVELEGQVCRIQLDIENIDFFPGSIAQREKLRKSIKDGEIHDKEAENQLRKSKEARIKLINPMSYKEHFITFRDSKLPKDGVLVVRTDALMEFESPTIANNDKKTEGKGRRPAQIKLLLSVIDALNYERLNIPVSEKQMVLKECLKSTAVFTSESVFNRVWSELSSSGQISITDKKNFL